MQTCSCPYEASASYIQVLTMYDTEVFLIVRDLVSPCNPVNNTEPNDGVTQNRQDAEESTYVSSRSTGSVRLVQ